MFPQPRHLVAFFALMIAALAALPVRAQAPTDPFARGDWTRWVPSDARLYVEFRDLSVIRHHLRRVGIWETVRDFAAPTAAGPDTRPWQQRTEQLLGMSAEEAVVRILGLRTALFAIDPLRWDQGLVLAELGDAALIPPLLERWRAERLEPVGRVRRFRLRAGLLVAQLDRTLLFGPESDEQSLWTRTVLLMAARGGPALANSPVFRELRSSLPDEFDGLAYLEWPPPRDASPETAQRAYAVTMDVAAESVSFEIAESGHDPTDSRRPPRSPVPAVMPPDTVFVWNGSLDVAALLAPDSDASPAEDRFALHRFLARALARASRPQDDVLAALGPAAAVVVGRQRARTTGDFDTPVATLVIETSKPGETAAVVDRMLEFVRFWLTAVSGDPIGVSRMLATTRRATDEVELSRLDLGPLLAVRTTCPFFARAELAWTITDRWLLISSSETHLEQVARAVRAGHVEPTDSPLAASPVHRDARTTDWLVIRGVDLASMLHSWLAYVERERPDALTADFWTRWARQRLQPDQRLGLGLRTNAARPNEAEVVEVVPGTPIARQVRVGDAIVAVAGTPLASPQPAREVADRFRAVSPGRDFVLTVRRGRNTFDVTVPRPRSLETAVDSFDPVAAVRYVAALFDRIDFATMSFRDDGPRRRHATLYVRWHRPAAAASPPTRR